MSKSPKSSFITLTVADYNNIVQRAELAEADLRTEKHTHAKHCGENVQEIGVLRQRVNQLEADKLMVKDSHERQILRYAASLDAKQRVIEDMRSSRPLVTVEQRMAEQRRVRESERDEHRAWRAKEDVKLERKSIFRQAYCAAYTLHGGNEAAATTAAHNAVDIYDRALSEGDL